MIPAKIASDKGRSFAAWWIFGVLLWIVALIAAVVIKDKHPDRRRECPRCMEWIHARAAVCPHCATVLVESQTHGSMQSWLNQDQRR